LGLQDEFSVKSVLIDAAFGGLTGGLAAPRAAAGIGAGVTRAYSVASGVSATSVVSQTIAPSGEVAIAVAAKSQAKRIVIGENMERVRATAQRLSAETFEGLGLESNRAWIRLKRAQGYDVYDIGPDFARRSQRVEQGIRPDSAFYNMERMEMQGYDKLIKLFERTGKYAGGVSGLE